MAAPRLGPRDGGRRAAVALGLLALALLSAGALLLLRARSERRPLPKLAGEPPAPAPASGGSDLETGERPERGNGRLYQPDSPELMSYGEFMDALGLEAERPAVAPSAAAFRRAFESEPALRGIQREFEEAEERGEPRTAREFLDALFDAPESRELATRFASEPGGAKALRALARSPELRELGASWVRALSSRRKGAAAGPEQGLLARLSAAISPRATGQRGPSTTSADAGGQARTAAGQVEGETTGSREAPGAHDVEVHLGAPAAALSERTKRFLELYPFLAELGTERLRRLEEQAPSYGLWGACFGLRLYADCKSACARDTRTEDRCDPAKEVKDPWKACLDWKGSDQACIPLCLAQGPCRVPPAVWTDYCVHRAGCCGKGGCRCCASPHHPHGFCRSAWEGEVLPDVGNIELPAEMFYPACSSVGDCDCCYDAGGKFAYDVLDPHGKKGAPVRSADGSACGFSCAACGPRGCVGGDAPPAAGAGPGRSGQPGRTFCLTMRLPGYQWLQNPSTCPRNAQCCYCCFDPETKALIPGSGEPPCGSICKPSLGAYR